MNGTAPEGQDSGVRIQDSGGKPPGGRPPGDLKLEIGDSKKAGGLQTIATADLAESKLNPRKEFDKAGLEELAESIRNVGVLEPLIVRPLGETLPGGSGKPFGGFEIVVGSRRFRAAKLARKETVPAIVRTLSDREALELQITENLQREDVKPLDEARGYRALIELWREEEKQIPRSARNDKAAGASEVQRVAEKIGKSASYVYQRLKLIDLTAEAQRALSEGKMTAGHAVQIARLQPAAQKEAIKTITEAADSPDRMTVRDLGEWIQTAIHRNLDKAPWKKDDASLLPEAGACLACPKRAGSNPQLYPDLKPMTCTDAACFEKKAEAFVKARLAEHPGAVKIATANLDWEDRQALRNQKEIITASEYSGETGWKPSKEGACEFTHPAIIAAGKLAQLGQSAFVCCELKCPVHGPSRSSYRREAVKAQPGAMNKERKEQIEKLWQRREKQAVRFALYDALQKKQNQMTTMPVEALRFAVREAYHAAHIYQDARAFLEKSWGVKSPAISPLDKVIAEADQNMLLRILLDLPLSVDVAEKFSDGKEIQLAAKTYGLPIEKIAAQVHAEWAEKKRISYAKRAARLAAEKAKAAKTAAPAKKPAAQAKAKKASPAKKARTAKLRKK
ncbi:MAG: ParB/RepB/Spo0J family partition protein [Terriglobia bacterium]